MATTLLKSPVQDREEIDPLLVESIEEHEQQQISLEDYGLNPPDGTEWVSGEIIEKTGMGFFHGRVQLKFGALLLDFVRANQLQGIVCTEVLCQTQKQARRPDVAYMSAQQAEDYGKTDFTILPECFPLVVEVVSPTDATEDVFAKAAEYLDAGADEVWLIFPKNRLIMTATLEQMQIEWSVFANQDRVGSPKILVGFSVVVDDLLPEVLTSDISAQ